MWNELLNGEVDFAITRPQFEICALKLCIEFDLSEENPTQTYFRQIPTHQLPNRCVVSIPIEIAKSMLAFIHLKMSN